MRAYEEEMSYKYLAECLDCKIAGKVFYREKAEYLGERCSTYSFTRGIAQVRSLWRYGYHLASDFLKVNVHQEINPIQAGGQIVPPFKITRTSSKRLGVWSCCFMIFFLIFSIQNILVPPIRPDVCCHGNHTTSA